MQFSLLDLYFGGYTIYGIDIFNVDINNANRSLFSIIYEGKRKTLWIGFLFFDIRIPL